MFMSANFSKYLSTYQSVLQSEAESILKVAQTINQTQIERLIKIFEMLKISGGKLVVCGVGKSGWIAQKISSTLSSLGLTSLYLHPTEALHGDLGRMNAQDAIIFISKSGTTEEIIKLIPYLPIAHEMIIGLLGSDSGPIAKSCHIVFDCSVEKEACINNQAPTNSSTVALAVGDAISVIYEEWVGLSREGFAQNHPGGLLGKSLSLKVKDLMVAASDCPQVQVENTMQQVLLEMTAKPTGLCFVLRKNTFAGIIVEGDIRRALTKNENALSFTADKIMNQNPRKISSHDLAYDALKLMESGERPISVLPVIDGDKMMGLIRLHDLMREGFPSSHK